MVPIYATMSFMSLVLGNKSIYFNSIREIYEAWVIYNFLSLCLAWVGGPGAVVTSLSGRVLKPSCYLMTCCLPPIPLDGRFIRRCKQGGLQFVILKPILVAVTFILDLLRPFNPVPKFVIIKSVVFLTYWQGVLVFLAAKSGIIKSAEEAADVQNFIICLEMAIAAVGHLYAFPYKEYAEANIGAYGGLTGSLTHALKFNDFYDDTVHQFAPTYHDYVLYSNEGEEGTRKYRARTFVPTGQEMDTVRKNRKIFGTGKTDDLYSVGVASADCASPRVVEVGHKSVKDPESMKSSLLFDPTNNFSKPYDIMSLESSVNERNPSEFNPRRV
ncbi:hypothetical protein SUGI_0345220 [Cryptomeria japonica]|nr:hypothetical protein SUGI_0345220 [Cryptomeria japonica]